MSAKNTPKLPAVEERAQVLAEVERLSTKTDELTVKVAKLQAKRLDAERALAAGHLAYVDDEPEAEERIADARAQLATVAADLADTEARQRIISKRRTQEIRKAEGIVEASPEQFAAAAADGVEQAQAAIADTLAAFDRMAAKLSENEAQWRIVAQLGSAENRNLTELRAAIQSLVTLPQHLRDKPYDLRSLSLVTYRIGTGGLIHSFPADHALTQRLVGDANVLVRSGNPILPEGSPAIRRESEVG